MSFRAPLMVWTVENGFRSCSCMCDVHVLHSCFASPLILLLFLTVCHKGHAHVECHISGYCIISLFASLQLSIIHSMQRTLHDNFHWYLQLLINNHCCTYIYIYVTHKTTCFHHDEFSSTRIWFRFWRGLRWMFMLTISKTNRCSGVTSAKQLRVMSLHILSSSAVEATSLDCFPISKLLTSLKKELFYNRFQGHFSYIANKHHILPLRFILHLVILFFFCGPGWSLLLMISWNDINNSLLLPFYKCGVDSLGMQ